MQATHHTTKQGTAFAALPASASHPAPTLLVLAMSDEDTLVTPSYARVGELLAGRGWNVVSLDLPCHGADRRTDEPEQLRGWAARVAAGEDIVAAFRTRVTDVLGHLIESGTADPGRIAAAGTSRGGYMAFQAAAGDARIRAVAGFAPVSDLLVLDEFSGQAANPLARRLALPRAAAALAGRAAWITIGGHDERVDTDRVIAFARTLVRAAVRRQRVPQVALHVLPTEGHASFLEWHDQAAEWLQTACAGPLEERS